VHQSDVAAYLIQSNLLTGRDVIDGDVLIVDVSRRNYNFKLVRKSGSGFMLKQGVGHERVASLAHEAEVYALLGRSDRSGIGLEHE
jgi:hypothetical protein